MKSIKTIFTTALVLATNWTFAQLESVITCWQQNTTTLGFAGELTNVQEVNYSDTYVYVKTDDVPSWIPIGYNWPNNPWFAEPMGYQFRIRRNPIPNVGPETETGYGHIALWKNGCSIYNPKDAKHYQNEQTWFQNAWFWEHLILETFDPCIGHPNGSGEYHTHVSPACLYDITDSTQAAPLLGYAFDGYPIYGGYAPSDPMDSNSPIVRLKSSYRLRNITDRSTLPDGTVLSASLYGPPIDTHTVVLDPLNNDPIACPLGAYMEDYEYVPGLGDLDEHNGRFCITADYPDGIYAYFTTIGWVTDHYDTSIKPVFPYVIGTTYYGEVYPNDGNTGPNSGFVVISEPVTPYVSTAGVSDMEEELKMDVFPNPTADQLNFQLTSTHSSTYVATIYNKVGKIMDEGEVVPGKMYSYNAGELPNGTYFIKIKTEEKTYTYKFVVAK